MEKVAAITGKHVSRVYRWMYSRKKGGTGGQVPYDDAVKLLAHSREQGLDLCPRDFFELDEEVAQ